MDVDDDSDDAAEFVHPAPGFENPGFATATPITIKRETFMIRTKSIRSVQGNHYLKTINLKKKKPSKKKVTKKNVRTAKVAKSNVTKTNVTLPMQGRHLYTITLHYCAVSSRDNRFEGYSCGESPGYKPS